MTVTADTFFGGSIGFGSSSINSIDILSGSRTGVSVVNINTSHTATSGDNHTYIPSDLVEGGNYQFDVLHDPDDDIDNLVGVSDTITITYPTPAGGMTGATKAFTGWIDGYDEQLPLEDKMSASLSLKVASDVTSTAST